MNTLIVYETMYGHTRLIAEAIADGLRSGAAGLAKTRVIRADQAGPEDVDWADVVICGGPTHMHGMARPSSRRSAVDATHRSGTALELDGDALASGVRELLDLLPDGQGKHAAAFDTRLRGPAVFTGRAAVGIARGLRSRGYTLVTEPESFLVTTHTQLVPGEVERAREWGAALAAEPLPTA